MTFTFAIQKAFLSQPHIFLKLFLLKIPYLLFDLGVLFTLPLFFNKVQSKRFAFLFWLFNPVVLVVSFVFGTVDIIAVFFLVIAFYQLYKNRIFLGILFLLVSTLAKFEALLVIPFVIIFIFKKKSFKISNIKQKFFFIFCIIFFTVLLGLFFSYIKWIFKGDVISKWPYGYFFATQIGEIRLIYLFFLIYAIVLLAYWYFSDNSFKNLWKFSLLGLLSFFALCFFHPQWFLIVIPFMCFAIIDNRQLFKVFVLQLIFYFAIFLWWGNQLTFHLPAPINPDFFFSLPEIWDIISTFFKAEVLINLLWTVFVAVTLFLMYLIIKSLNLNKKEH